MLWVSDFILFYWWLILGALVEKNLPDNSADAGYVGCIPGLRRFPGEGNGTPTPVFLPGNFHGQRSLAGYSPQCHKELDMTGHTHTSNVTLYEHIKICLSCLLVTLFFLITKSIYAYYRKLQNTNEERRKEVSIIILSRLNHEIITCISPSSFVYINCPQIFITYIIKVLILGSSFTT